MAYICYDGKEYCVNRFKVHTYEHSLQINLWLSKFSAILALIVSFQIMCKSELAWVLGCDGSIPDGAIPTGKSKNGETLYIGRTEIEDCITHGRVTISLKL